jgi:hypothetical protein
MNKKTKNKKKSSRNKSKNKKQLGGGNLKKNFGYIMNPLTNRNVKINGIIGKRILQNYKNYVNFQNGGEGSYPSSIGMRLWSQEANSNILKFNCDMNIPVTEGCARFGNKLADPHGITYQKGGILYKKIKKSAKKIKK